MLTIGRRAVGKGQPAYIIGEIGLNHNGDIEIAKKLIDVAAFAGCDAVKFQKRDPETCVPPEQRNVLRETPWGTMTYLEYRHAVEFGEDQYAEIDRYCKAKEIDWFVSCWDASSVGFTEKFSPVCYKIASATLTDLSLMRRIASTRRPVMLSTGMSTMEEIDAAVNVFDREQLLIAHATSAYPCKAEEINLRMIHVLRDTYADVPIGYSGHEVGLQITLAAVALGAAFVERHITLDRTMWGSDHAASVEPQGLIRLCRDIRVIEQAMGDGVKRVYDSELPIRKKLRRVGIADLQGQAK
ncbi:N-acetylneuraminate synthase family protein [Blastopirellula marina]|uniref:Sialic acid synthase n=1 Tax=Blastopirellula marina DSM 3645 TaxID=314230 RepID=A3ZPD7_9BACT|nr:N-acetylneuraminate synthase family protein [Blastopirellula marina]EAQ81615.1 sialic acid synthase [Blastopirellula marina DSM 3645]